MEKETSLIFLSRAETMLVKASSIQEIKEFKDIALTAKDWAQRKGLGEKAIKEANSYVLRSERKLGQMLKETERQKPGEYQRSTEMTVAPTLAELGLTKNESSEAQLLAEVDDEESCGFDLFI